MFRKVHSNLNPLSHIYSETVLKFQEYCTAPNHRSKILHKSDKRFWCEFTIAGLFHWLASTIFKLRKCWFQSKFSICLSRWTSQIHYFFIFYFWIPVGGVAGDAHSVEKQETQTGFETGSRRSDTRHPFGRPIWAFIVLTSLYEKYVNPVE